MFLFDSRRLLVVWQRLDAQVLAVTNLITNLRLLLIGNDAVGDVETTSLRLTDGKHAYEA